MSSRGELLELLQLGPTRFSTLQATARTWHSATRYRTAGEKAVGRAARGWDLGAQASEGSFRLWLDGASRFRIEQDLGESVHLLVADGDQWRWHRPGRGTLGGPGQPIYYANPLRAELDILVHLAWLDYELIGPAEHAGRPCLRVRGRPVEPEEVMMPAPSGMVGDERDMLVDTRTGVVLRFENRVDGEAFYAFELSEIAFDQHLDPALFSFEPPDGEEVRSLEDERRETLIPLGEAAERASFTVLAPQQVPGGLCPRVRYRPGGSSPEHLSLSYRLPGAGSLILEQWQHGADVANSDGFAPLEWAGQLFSVKETDDGSDGLHVAFEKLGTRVLALGVLPRDELLDLLAGMTPVAAGEDDAGRSGRLPGT